jgi:hypothetical protein
MREHVLGQLRTLAARHAKGRRRTTEHATANQQCN